MTDKQAVIDALNRLPEVASLEEITQELHIMAAIRRGRDDIARGNYKSQEEVEQLVDSWATSWTSRLSGPTLQSQIFKTSAPTSQPIIRKQPEESAEGSSIMFES